MAQRFVRIAGLGLFGYDDSAVMRQSTPTARPVTARPSTPRPTTAMEDVLDGAGQPVYERAIFTDGAMRSDMSPAEDNEVMRKADLSDGTVTELRLGNWRFSAAGNVLTISYWNGTSWIDRTTDEV